MDKKKQQATGIAEPQSTAIPATGPQANTASSRTSSVTTKQTGINPTAINQSYYKPAGASQPVVTYQPSAAVQQAGQALADHESNRPSAYQSTYGDQIQQMIDSIMGREKFTYDYSTNPLYQQYAQEYQRGGQLAMKDAMAESAALTSGYGNTFAQQLGQQTYQRYMEDMAAQIPQLQQAAYAMYQDEGDTMRANLSMLQGADDTDYGRYRDTIADYNDLLNYLYSKYYDMSETEYDRYLNWQNDAAYWEAMNPVATGGSGGSSKSKGSAYKETEKSPSSTSASLVENLKKAAEKTAGATTGWSAAEGPEINKKKTMQTRN